MEGSCGHLVRLQTCYTGISCWIVVVCDSTLTVVYVCLELWPHTETTPKPDLQHRRTWYHIFFFEKLEGWVVYRVLTLMCYFVCGCGPGPDVSTRRSESEWPSLDMCESIPGRVWSVTRMVGVWRAVGGILLHCRLSIQGSLVWLQVTVVRDRVLDGFVSGCLDTWPHTETTPKPDLQHSRTWYHRICFEKLEEWVVYTVLTLMCCFVCGCGPYGWRVDSRFSLWVIPPLTCVNRFQDECEVCEGWSVYGGLLWASCYTTDFLYRDLLLGDRLQLFLVGSMTDLCLEAWPHIERTPNRTWNTVELDIIEFVLRNWWSESCTEYWLWCAALCVGSDRTGDDSTRGSVREWTLPWHVWIDSRTSVKCVKDGRCIEGCCGHLVRLQPFYTGLSC
jgi:hypothetical protein